MQASTEQLNALRSLQEVDRMRIQALSALEKLPQPVRAAELRTKMEAVAGKMAQIKGMADELQRDIEGMERQDAELAEKQRKIQESIGEEQGDYRRLNALTRDLEGCAKKRETFAFESGKLRARLGELESLLEQATHAQDALAKQESDLAEEYRKKGSALKAQVEHCLAQREPLLAQLGNELAEDYERTIKRCGGVALSTLEGGSCSACRAVIDQNRILQMRKEAPISHCPNCGRLSILASQDMR